MSKKVDKYALYQEAVQDAPRDVDFFEMAYKNIWPKNKPTHFREDFCGTGLLCAEWVRRGKDRQALGIDINPIPLAYGQSNVLAKLPSEAQARITLANANVLEKTKAPVDIIAASNFSYFVFKKRTELLCYFKNSFASLKDRGIFVIDVLGGSEVAGNSDEEREIEPEKGSPFTYVWEQHPFDPINNFTKFDIHFELSDGTRLEKAFSYDWRIWSIPELRELLLEAGFSKVEVYWEEDDEDDEGTGEFIVRESVENTAVWVVYLVAST